MNAIELMTKLNESPVEEWATIAANSGIAGAKDVYLAMGKSHSIPLKDLEAWWKAAQPEKAKSAGGFAADFYSWLAECERTEAEATAFIMGENILYGDTTQNTKKHLTHFLNIWALAETVRSGETVVRTTSAKGASSKKASGSKKTESEPSWEYDEGHPFADVKSAKETLKREKQRAKPRKTRIHPDKVAHLNDPELTKMFTEAFKAYFG